MMKLMTMRLLMGAAACLTSGLAACAPPVNPAEEVAATIVAGLVSVHPEPICDNGDAGVGIDNDVPWYTVYIFLDQTPDLDQFVIVASGKAGFQLEIDQELVDAYKRGIVNRRHAGDPTGVPGVRFDPTTSFLVAIAADRQVRATLIRRGEIGTDCRGVEQWGKSATVRPGRAILRLDVTLPKS
jgi:hypothetical protein